MAISAGDLTLLRDPWHKQTHFLSVFVPSIILTAQVNGSPSLGAQTFNFDNGLGYSGQNIEGMTLTVETLTGTERIRLKSISTSIGVTGSITVAENSINWADNQVITIRQEYLFWPKLPRFIAAGTFWKDYNITYSGQTQTKKTTPVCNIGSHQAGFLTGATKVFQLSAADSYATAFGGTISSYSWSTTHGTLSSTTIVNPTLTFSTVVPNGAIVSCTVTDSFGNTQQSHRIYFVHSPVSTSANYPIVDFEYESSPAGDWDKGGWDVRLRVSQQANISTFPDGTLIVLWEESIFGDTTKSIGFTGSNIVFAGYLRSESIQSDSVGYQQTSFQASTIQEIMNNHFLLSVSMEVSDSPDTWWKYNNYLNTARAIHFYLKWHSTLFEIADVFLDIDSTVYRKYATFDSGSMLQSLSAVTEQAGEFVKIACNKQGQVYAEIDIQLLNDTDRALIETLAEIELSDIKDDIRFNRIQPTDYKVAQIQLSGFAYDGTTPVAKTSQAPGTAPSPFGGSLVPVERQIFASQQAANELAGRLLAKQNNSFTDIQFSFNGNWGGYLDIVPQKWFTLSVSANDTNRDVVWVSQKIVPRSISFQETAGIYLPDVSFEKESLGYDGVAGNYSTAVTTSTGNQGTNVGGLITASSVYTKYGLETSWTLRTSDATSCICLDPFWKIKTGSSLPTSSILIRGGIGILTRTVNGCETWTSVLPETAPPNTYLDSPAPKVEDLTYAFLSSDKGNSDVFYAIGSWVNLTLNNRYWILKTTDSGTTWSWI